MRLITPGISGQTGRDHQAVKVKVVASVLLSAPDITRLERAQRSTCDKTDPNEGGRAEN